MLRELEALLFHMLHWQEIGKQNMKNIFSVHKDETVVIWWSSAVWYAITMYIKS